MNYSQVPETKMFTRAKRKPKYYFQICAHVRLEIFSHHG